MKFIKFLPNGSISEEVLSQGIHYIDVALNEVPLFIRKDRCIPLAQPAECVDMIDTKHLTMIGYKGAEYIFYDDDGVHKDYENPENYRTLRM